MALFHSGMLRSQLWRMSSGKLEAVRTDQRRKIGSMPPKPCALVLTPRGPHRRPQAFTLIESFNRKEEKNMMKPSTTDQIKGSFHEMKGTAKEKAGKVTNNPNLTNEGRNEKLAGKVQKKVGQIEKVLEK
jgi:uncharacterized protein YjbJ (UPF0337 family)